MHKVKTTRAVQDILSKVRQQLTGLRVGDAQSEKTDRPSLYRKLDTVARKDLDRFIYAIDKSGQMEDGKWLLIPADVYTTRVRQMLQSDLEGFALATLQMLKADPEKHASVIGRLGEDLRPTQGLPFQPNAVIAWSRVRRQLNHSNDIAAPVAPTIASSVSSVRSASSISAAPSRYRTRTSRHRISQPPLQHAKT